MIKLINGRGQLGCKLSFLQKLATEAKIYIYHTWNINDKSEKTQEEEYNKFVEFTDSHKDFKMIFISTLSNKKNFYTFYKLKSENYLLSKNPKGIVIRLPTIIGKGVFEDFKNGSATPHGDFYLCTMNDVVNFIESSIQSEASNKIFELTPEKISAKVVYELINFGKI